MIEKYKLRVMIRYQKTVRQASTTCRSWVWDNKEDALACKALLEKAVAGAGLTVEFVSFTEERLLDES